MSGTRRGLVVGCAAILLAALLWQLHGRSETPTTTATTSAPTAPTATTAPASARPTTPATVPTGPTGPTIAAAPGSAASPTDEVRPAPNPPSLDAPHAKPAPAQKGFTREETIAKREADLKLLDDTKTRLEKDLDAARTASDKTAVHDLEVRLARLVDTRKKRVTELEQIRAGGALPQ